MQTTSGSLDKAPKNMPSSVGRAFLDRVKSTPQREAFRTPSASGWTSMTWAQANEIASELAAGLLSLGLNVEDRVGIAAGTRTDWILADCAIMLAGGATTTVYPSTQAEDVAYILGDADVKVLFAEDAKQLDKVNSQRDQLPDLHTIVMIDGDGDGGSVLSWQDLRNRGKELLAQNPNAIEERVAQTGPENLATLIYTSGTTGKPKGVELPHRCWTYEGATLDQLGILTPDDVHYLWLPLAHSFGKVLISAQIQIGFVSAVDGRVDQILANLGTVQPTFMAGVPRIFEKVYAGISSRTLNEGGSKAKIFNWAFGVGKKVKLAEYDGKSVSALDKAQYALAHKLVFSKIHAALGGRIRYFISGSAALNRDVAEWFAAAGLLILEGYGLTETSAGTCLQRPERVKFGTVGEPLDGTEIKIAEDGEILIRGLGVMRGYRNLPDQTAEVMLADGWFASGDVGEIDDVGRVKITDRKKDLVKTSGGKYIAPGAIEATFKAICPIASNMVVHVENRNYATALVTLDPDAMKAFAAANGLSGDFAKDSQDPKVRAAVQKSVDELNSRLNRWETIKDFRVLDRDLTIEDGELTPSLKLKRKVVEKKYAELLDSMYSS